MGLQGIDVQLTGQLREISKVVVPPTEDEETNNLTKLKNWLADDKSLRIGFRKGRFGLRMNDMPQFNLTPTVDFAYVLNQTKIIRDGEFKEKASVVITLLFSGDVEKWKEQQEAMNP